MGIGRMQFSYEQDFGTNMSVACSGVSEVALCARLSFFFFFFYQIYLAFKFFRCSLYVIVSAATVPLVDIFNLWNLTFKFSNGIFHHRVCCCRVRKGEGTPMAT